MIYNSYKQFENMCLEMVVFHPMHICMSIFSKEDDAHVHLHPKIPVICSVHVQCQGHGIGHNKALG